METNASGASVATRKKSAITGMGQRPILRRPDVSIAMCSACCAVAGSWTRPQNRR
jgi:hypothetical protein